MRILCLILSFSSFIVCGQNVTEELKDTCLRLLPERMINPSPFIEGSSELFYLTSKFCLDSVSIVFINESKDTLASVVKYNIEKDEIYYLGEFLNLFFKTEEFESEEVHVPIFWSINYWLKGSLQKNKCFGMTYFILFGKWSNR